MSYAGLRNFLQVLPKEPKFPPTFIEHLWSSQTIIPNAMQHSKTCINCKNILPPQLCVIFGEDANFFCVLFHVGANVCCNLISFFLLLSIVLIQKEPCHAASCHLSCSHPSPPLSFSVSHPLMWSYKVTEQNFPRRCRTVGVYVCSWFLCSLVHDVLR